MKKEQEGKERRETQMSDQAGKQGNNITIPSDPENKRNKKPGSQSNSSKQSNNGRGGGK